MSLRLDGGGKPSGMNKKLPNLLTIARLILSIVFFALLAGVHIGESSASSLLGTAFVIYIVAGITDVLDGYLARKWKVTSTFGRLADPIVDKVIVCGAFAMLAGHNFSATAGQPLTDLERHLPNWIHGSMHTGVQAWMVVVLIAREFVISGIRGYSESQGINFPATQAGKLKMFVQSAAICAILIQLAWLPTAAWIIILKLVLVWLTVLITFFSGLLYTGKARKLLMDAARG